MYLWSKFWFHWVFVDGFSPRLLHLTIFSPFSPHWSNMVILGSQEIRIPVLTKIELSFGRRNICSFRFHPKPSIFHLRFWCGVFLGSPWEVREASCCFFLVCFSIALLKFSEAYLEGGWVDMFIVGDVMLKWWWPQDCLYCNLHRIYPFTCRLVDVRNRLWCFILNPPCF